MRRGGSFGLAGRIGFNWTVSHGDDVIIKIWIVFNRIYMIFKNENFEFLRRYIDKLIVSIVESVF